MGQDPYPNSTDILCKFKRNVDENIGRIGIKALKLQLLMEMNLAAVEMILKKGKKERRKNTKSTKRTKMQRSVRKRKKKRRKNEAKRTKICSNTGGSTINISKP